MVPAIKITIQFQKQVMEVIKGAVFLMLVKPLVNNTCLVYRLIIILGDSTPTKKENQHEVQLIRVFLELSGSSGLIVCYVMHPRPKRIS